MEHLEPSVVGLERALMVNTKTLDRLMKELEEAEKKSKDPSTTSDKKTFLKVQIPKLTTEIATTKSKVANLMEADELDPRGEWFVLAKKLLKKK